MDHPAIEHLEGTPEILRLLMGPVSEAQANWKPAPDRWSIAEVMEHLSHVEAHIFRARFELLAAQEGAALEPYDQNEYAAAGTYSGRDPEESFAHWEEQRENNIELLRGMEDAVLKRAGAHPELGRVTLEDVLNEWAFHDLGHVRQIAELVRAQLYYPGLGPFGKDTQVNP